MVTLNVPFKAEDMEGLMKSIINGKYSPIPGSFSKELSQFINQMLQLKPKNRPTSDKLLRMPIVQRKMEELHLNDSMGKSYNQKELLATIKMPRKLQYLTDRLPKSNYSLNLSYENVKKSIEAPHRAERERTSKPLMMQTRYQSWKK